MDLRKFGLGLIFYNGVVGLSVECRGWFTSLIWFIKDEVKVRNSTVVKSLIANNPSGRFSDS